MTKKLNPIQAIVFSASSLIITAISFVSIIGLIFLQFNDSMWDSSEFDVYYACAVCFSGILTLYIAVWWTDLLDRIWLKKEKKTVGLQE